MKISYHAYLPLFVLMVVFATTVTAQTSPEVPGGDDGYCQDFDVCLSASAYAGMGNFSCPGEEFMLMTYNTTCPDAQDGILIAQVSGGKPPYSIRWSTGENGPKISGLAPGRYAVTITDNDGCRLARETRISAAPMPQIQWNISGGGKARRNQPAPAREITVTIDAENNCFQFQWDGQPDTDTPTLKNATPGPHYVRITDQNGCVYTEEIFVPE